MGNGKKYIGHMFDTKRICPRCGKVVEGAKNKKFCDPKHRREFNLFRYLEKGQVKVVAQQP